MYVLFCFFNCIAIIIDKFTRQYLHYLTVVFLSSMWKQAGCYVIGVDVHMRIDVSSNMGAVMKKQIRLIHSSLHRPGP